jgi:hypothetical protein
MDLAEQDREPRDTSIPPPPLTPKHLEYLPYFVSLLYEYQNAALVSVKGQSGSSWTAPLMWRANTLPDATCITKEGISPVYPNPGPSVEYGGEYASQKPTQPTILQPCSLGDQNKSATVSSGSNGGASASASASAPAASGAGSLASPSSSAAAASSESETPAAVPTSVQPLSPPAVVMPTPALAATDASSSSSSSPLVDEASSQASSLAEATDSAATTTAEAAQTSPILPSAAASVLPSSSSSSSSSNNDTSVSSSSSSSSSSCSEGTIRCDSTGSWALCTNEAWLARGSSSSLSLPFLSVCLSL